MHPKQNRIACIPFKQNYYMDIYLLKSRVVLVQEATLHQESGLSLQEQEPRGRGLWLHLEFYLKKQIFLLLKVTPPPKCYFSILFFLPTPFNLKIVKKKKSIYESLTKKKIIPSFSFAPAPLGTTSEQNQHYRIITLKTEQCRQLFNTLSYGSPVLET